MPYIKQDRKKELDPAIDALIKDLFYDGGRTALHNDEGEYNYVISRLIHAYVKRAGLRYRHLNAAVGILECAKAEFIRTVVSPYEDKKIEENGPVSDLDGGQ